jgi:hypothetical protein
LPELRAAPEKGWRSIKCVVVPASLGERPVVVKALAGTSPLWRFHLVRERAIYELFARCGLPPIEPVRVPRLVAAVEGELLVLDRMPGEPVARVRHPSRTPDVGDFVWEALLIARSRLQAWSPALAPGDVQAAPLSLRSDMRRRLLEDPSADGAWIANGIERLRSLGTLEEVDAGRMLEALAESPATSFGHGDLLLRNILVDSAGSISLVDWECAGTHPEAWDAALLWVFAPTWVRRRLEEEHARPVSRHRAFLSCVAFALTREAFYRSRHGSVDAVARRLLEERAPVLGALDPSTRRAQIH